MTSTRGRRGGWLWPAVFVVSAFGVLAVVWQILSAASLVGAVAQPGDIALPASPSTSGGPTPSRSTRQAPNKDGGPGAWPTREATPDRTATAAAGLPQQLTISRLRLKMPIVATTLDDAGLMALPERPSKIGWYSYGPRPGGSGSAVLAGHVDSRRYGIGPLAGLRRLSRGDEIVVRTAEGPVSFEVRSVQVINKRALPLSEIFDRDGPPRLRIVSCGGAYLPARGGYQDNVVVTAVPR